MAFAAAIPLIASLIPAIGGLFGGGNKEGEGGGGGNANLAATHAALGTALASKDSGGGIIADHPVTKGTDLPPILATALSANKSGHVLPHAATASGKMGHAGVLAPHLEAALTATHATQQSAPILRHQEKASRAMVKRVQSATAPQLQQMSKQLRDRATQIQATAEHRSIVQRDTRHREQAQKLEQIASKLERLSTQLRHRWAV